MINFDFETYCCGCMACYNACVCNAINMEANAEGFLMPKVDRSKCVECGRCDAACPYINHEKAKETNLMAATPYLFYCDDIVARKKSASGGAFFALAKAVIEEGGFVCGCIWNDRLEAEHIVSNRMDDIIKMQSSKYTQSVIGNCYKQIEQLLKEGNKVLFSGTPCQVSGLKKFLKNSYDNLYNMSVICHGVPSPEVWKRYKEALEKRFDANMTYVNMRDKRKYGYPKTVCRYEFENGKIVEWETYLRDIYCFSFTDDLFIRKACLSCSYKGEYSEADIIVGDYHGKHNEKGAGKAGISILVCLNEKGLFMMKNYLKNQPIRSENKSLITSNDMLWHSTRGNIHRKQFFLNYRNEEITKCIKRFLPLRFKVKVLLNKIGLFPLVKKIENGMR